MLWEIMNMHRLHKYGATTVTLTQTNTSHRGRGSPVSEDVNGFGKKIN
jgi:hypothetical protein